MAAKSEQWVENMDVNEQWQHIKVKVESTQQNADNIASQ